LPAGPFGGFFLEKKPELSRFAPGEIRPGLYKSWFRKKGWKPAKNEDQPDFDLPFIFFGWSAEKGLFPPAAF
jgi:hypothetical protein